MVDRRTTYFGQVPLETDLLYAQQYGMVGLAKFCAAVLGTPTYVNAFTCTPTTPASLNVLLTPGEIYQLANLEATNWSSLLADSAHSVVKQGILLDALTFGITPPATVGFSQVFLIEVQYADSDTGATVLPYYNAASPATPFSGPANAGTANNTVRKGAVTAQVKAGVAAATGTQTAPTADAGWTGIFTVTVANGATTITSGNIAKVSGAPFIPVTLPMVPSSVQTSAWTYATDTGVAGAMIATLNPPLTSYTAGDRFSVKVAYANVGGATTINFNGQGVKNVTRWDGSALLPNQLQPGMIIDLQYDGANFQWMNQYVLRLNGPLDIYVNASTGSDSNNGLSAGSAFATIQHAISITLLYDWNNNNVTIHVADGSYAGQIALGPTLNGIGTLKLLGNSTTPGNCVISASNASAINVFATARSPITIEGFKLVTTGTPTSTDPGDLVLAHVQSIVALKNIEYGASIASHIAVDDCAFVLLQGQQIVSGSTAGGSSHMFAHLGGSRIMSDPGNPVTMTISAAVTVGYWAQAVTAASIEVTYSSVVNPGNVTGQRYIAQVNGMILTKGGGANYYPGTIAGSTNNGGIYL